MIAYHGTTKENKVNIVKEGFRFDTEIKQGKLFGDAIYFTTSRKRAKEFGTAIIKVDINVDKFKFIEDIEEYNDFFSYYVQEALPPYYSIDEYLLDKFKSIKEQDEFFSINELQKVFNSIAKEAEYKVGTFIRNGLISKGYNGLALLMSDEDIDYDYYELTVYDDKDIQIFL